jgi:hypothetical protein
MFFLFWGPNLGVRTLLGDAGLYVWNMFLITGGLVSGVGAWKRLFRVEIIGTPLLFSGLVVYGGYFYSRVGESAQPGAIAGLGTVFVGAGVLFLGKGLAIWIHKIRVADAFERRRSDAE